MDFKTIDPAKIIHDKDLRSEFVKIYNSSGLGQLQECNNCNGAFENAILKYQKKHIMLQKEFELLPNKVLHFEGKDYVNANITDEVALRAVQAGYSALFKRIPLELPQEVKVSTKPLKRGRKRKA